MMTMKMKKLDFDFDLDYFYWVLNYVGFVILGDEVVNRDRLKSIWINWVLFCFELLLFFFFYQNGSRDDNVWEPQV